MFDCFSQEIYVIWKKILWKEFTNYNLMSMYLNILFDVYAFRNIQNEKLAEESV